MSLTLSRIEIESVGSDPRKLAHALLAQLPDFRSGADRGDRPGARHRLHEVAPLASVEGCLHCDPLKSEEQIVVNANSPQGAAITPSPTNSVTS